MRDILRILIEVPLYYISGLFNRKKNRIIFGAWNGEKYADNSKYMLEYLKDKKEYELIWCGKKEIKSQVPKNDNIKFVEHGSLKSYYYALTSKYVFITHSQNDVSKFNVFRKAKVIQLWHGIGIKKVGLSALDMKNLRNKIRVKFQNLIRKYDYFICSSEANRKRNLIAFSTYGINPNNVINSGQPRNDLFFNFSNVYVHNIRNNYFERYGIPINKKIVTYLPTFRKDKNQQFLFSNLSKEYMNELERTLKEYNAILLEKVHHQDKDVNNKEEIHNKFIYNVGDFDDIDTQELLLISDMLITDYSSCYMDYVLLNRPVIHFAYDYEKYKNRDQGFYYDLYDIAAGDIVTEIVNLIESIRKNLEDISFDVEARMFIKKTMMEYENGNSCEIILKRIGII